MSKKRVIQTHHITYEDKEKGIPEETVRVYKGEHLMLTRLDWRKNFSKGFVKALETKLKEIKKIAVELERAE